MGKTNESKSDLQTDTCEQPYRERRCGTDRRKDKRAQLKYILFNGRRENFRREQDRTKAFLFDRYNQRIFAAITAILMLSIVDALLTLILIDRGSTELNPVMAYFLAYGPLPFLVVKYILTSFGVVILLIFKNVFINRINIYTHSIFPCMIFAFSTVILWELFLIFRVL